MVGFVDDDILTKGMRIYGTKVIGASKDIPQIVEKYNVGLIILADHRINYKEYSAITGICDSSAINVVVIPDIFGSLTGLSREKTTLVEPCNGIDMLDFRCQRCIAKYAPSSST